MAKNAVSVQADTDFTEARNVGLPRDVNSRDLSVLAKARAKEQRISFGEALSAVASERPDLTGDHLQFSEQQRRRPHMARDLNSIELSVLAKARSRELNISFCEALSEVASERPELTVPYFEF